MTSPLYEKVKISNPLASPLSFLPPSMPFFHTQILSPQSTTFSLKGKKEELNQ
jgi:hypothetical protein